MSLLIGALQGKSSRLTAYGEIHIKWFSDAGSPPAGSTQKRSARVALFFLVDTRKTRLTACP